MNRMFRILSLLLPIAVSESSDVFAKFDFAELVAKGKDAVEKHGLLDKAKNMATNGDLLNKAKDTVEKAISAKKKGSADKKKDSAETIKKENPKEVKEVKKEPEANVSDSGKVEDNQNTASKEAGEPSVPVISEPVVQDQAKQQSALTENTVQNEANFTPETISKIKPMFDKILKSINPDIPPIISFSEMNLTDEDMVYFCEQLKEVIKAGVTKGVAILLSKNQITPVGFQTFLNFLMENPTFASEIDFSNNNIGDNGALILSTSLGKIPSIKTFYISNINMTDIGATELAKAFASFAKTYDLSSVSFSNNKQITAVGALQIAEYLSDLRPDALLDGFDLTEIPFSKNTVDAIMVKTNKITVTPPVIEAQSRGVQQQPISQNGLSYQQINTNAASQNIEKVPAPSGTNPQGSQLEVAQQMLGAVQNK